MENGTCNRGYKCGRNVSKRVARYELVTWMDNVIVYTLGSRCCSRVGGKTLINWMNVQHDGHEF